MSRRKARESSVITVNEYRAMQREKDLQKRLEETVGNLGYLHFHDRDSRRNEAGLPDLVIVGHGLLFMAELKAATGRLRHEQRLWMNELQRVETFHADVIWPQDIDDFEDYLREQAQRSK